MTLACGTDGVSWIGTFHQLFRRERPGATWVRELEGANDERTRWVHGLAFAREGALCALVGSRQNGTGRSLRREATGWQVVLDRDCRNFSQPLFLAAAGEGGVWFPTTGPQVGCWRDGRLTEYALPSSLCTDVFLCLAADGESNLWVGTSRRGLLCLQPRRIRTLTATDGLPSPETWTLLEASDGALWVGTQEGAVRLIRAERNTFAGASVPLRGKLRALAEDLDGRIWLGSGAGLYRWRRGELERREFAAEPHRNKIRVLHTGHDGAVWAGTAQGRYRFRAGATNAWQVADGLPHENVCALLEDRERRLWIGSDGGGLARLTDTGFERFDASRGLASLRVWALHEDADGILWIGTDRGLHVLRQDRIAVITTRQGLPDNLVNGIVSDGQDGLWVGHDRGIYRVDRHALLEVVEGRRHQVPCVTYTEPDGLLNPETNGQISYPPAIRLRDGRIAFATMGGVALFDPAALPDLTNGPPA